MTNRKPGPRRAFTLVEFLTVLAIIGILSAIGVSVFARTKEKDRQAICTSNLKQIALAMQQYVQDFDGTYPPSMGENNAEPGVQGWIWKNKIAPYLKSKQVFLCPSYSDVRESSPVNPLMEFDYDYNFLRLNSMPKSGTVKARHESAEFNAATIWLNFDQNYSEIYAIKVISSCNRPFLWNTRHSGGANYSFLDGHVKWLTPTAISNIECLNGPLSPPFDAAEEKLRDSTFPVRRP